VKCFAERPKRVSEISPKKIFALFILYQEFTFAIDHRVWKIGLPVRSAVLKPYAGRLVVGWVTTSESLLLIVLQFLSFGRMPDLD
jgi:hypothetical protein